MMKSKSGWKGESRRHSLAKKGIKTANGTLITPEEYREYSKDLTNIGKIVGMAGGEYTQLPNMPFSMDCSKLRQTEEGERFWQKMMRNKREIYPDEFVNRVDIDTLLEEGETIEEFIADDPDAKFYESLVNGEQVYFIQTAGFEFIFRDHDVDKIKLSDTLIDTARNEYLNSGDIQYDIDQSARGVTCGFQTKIDYYFNEKHQDTYNANHIYDSFSKTRKLLQEQFGDTITLYRFQGNRCKIKNKHTLNWIYSVKMKRRIGEMYEDYYEPRVLLKKEIPIKDIVAVNVGKSGTYEEFIVLNHDSEGLVYPKSYGVI